MRMRGVQIQTSGDTVQKDFSKILMLIRRSRYNPGGGCSVRQKVCREFLFHAALESPVAAN